MTVHLLTTTEAALLARVRPGTIRQWVARGHLHPTTRDHRDRPLFTPRDVWDAEHATRTSDPSRRATRRALAR